MIIEALKTIFRRDLLKLKQEIEAYKSDEKIWLVGKGINKSAGNLCLHLVGNLNGFIGTELGKTGYVRHRDAEFSMKNVPRAELVKQMDDTIQMIETTLNQLKDEQLAEDFSIIVFEKKMTTGYFL